MSKKEKINKESEEKASFKDVFAQEIEETESEEETINEEVSEGEENSDEEQTTSDEEVVTESKRLEELNDRLIRTMAEFDNFRKRSEKEKSAMFEIGAKSIVEKILPVIDNFERGFTTVTEEEKDNAFVKGMEQIYKQFTTTLTEAGVIPIEAVGKEFDPNLHNAVMHAEDEELGTNIVTEEFQKGYMYKESVVRHSMVKVVN